MEIPLTHIPPTGEPRDGEISPAVPGNSPGGRIDEPLPGVGEAPLPPVGLAQLREFLGSRVGEPVAGVGEAPLPPVRFVQLKQFNEAQVAEWLDRIRYLKEFTRLDAATNKQQFLEMDLTGAVLLERGSDVHALLPRLSLGKALRLNTIIKCIYLDEGIFSPSLTNSTLLTII